MFYDNKGIPESDNIELGYFHERRMQDNANYIVISNENLTFNVWIMEWNLLTVSGFNADRRALSQSNSGWVDWCSGDSSHPVKQCQYKIALCCFEVALVSPTESGY